MLKLRIANLVRKEKEFENRYFLYKKIDKNPGLTIYDLSKKVKWSTGKVNYYVKKLLKDGIVQNSAEIINGRTRIFYSSTPMKEMINWEEMKHVKPEDIDNR